MSKIKLGVNIDHVATVRNARGETYPSPLRAALLSQNAGADSVTIHLREDRRHIRDNDLKLIKSKLKIPLNLEIAATKEMIKIALKNKPTYVCIVPEKRKEITTEGGLNLEYKKSFLKKIITELTNNNSRVSLFIEPKKKDIDIAKNLGAKCVELHSGKICNLINKNKSYIKELKNIKKSINYGNKIGLEVHVGHGITFKSAKILSKIKGIKEFNVGHFLIGESIFLGLRKSIKKLRKIIK